MRLVAVGIDHHKAPAALREAVAMPEARVGQALCQLRQEHPGHEFTIISTCNRVELFAATDQDHVEHGRQELDGQALTRFLAEFHGLKPTELAPHTSIYHDDGVVGHLFRVSSSVESIVLGEGQILGQVREAYQQAVSAQSVGWIHHAIFQHALKVGKKVRETTGLGVGKLSVASVAVDVARDVFDQFHDKTVLVIGAGEMAELALRHMMGLKPGRVIVVNRSFERGRQLADQFGGEAWEFSELNQGLIEADLIVSTTASPNMIVDLETFARVQRARKYRLALILDIAIPRDFDERIGQLDQVMLYNVDDLKTQVERNMAQRRGGLNAANLLIETETAACMAALRHQKHASNVLKQLGEHADRIRESELKSLFDRIPGLSEKERREVERMAHRLQNQLLHEPRAALRSSAKSQDNAQWSLPSAVGHLFGLGGGFLYRRRQTTTTRTETKAETVEMRLNG